MPCVTTTLSSTPHCWSRGTTVPRRHALHRSPRFGPGARIHQSPSAFRRTPAGRTDAVLTLSRPAEETHCTAAVFRPVLSAVTVRLFCPRCPAFCCCLLPFCCRSPPRPFLSSPLGLSAVAARTLAVAIRFPDGLSRIAFRFL